MKRKAGSKRNPTAAPRFRHVLVPTDLTERTEKALQLVDKLVVSDASRITLMHVIETIDGVPFDELKPFYEQLEQKARPVLNRLAGRIPQGRAQVECVTLYGRRVETIVEFAVKNDVDLITLASHRVHPSLANRDWGTISYQVGILAECPVLLVK